MKLSARCWFTATFFGIAVIASTAAVAEKNYAPGVTDTEIKVGQTMPYSGPASAWGTVGLAELAYIKMINDRGGIAGRKITLVSLDDSFSPPKTVEQTRKLIEEEGVAFIYGTLGPGNGAIRKYLNDKKVPQVFVAAPLEKYNDPQHFPWTMGLLPTYYLEGKTHAQYILAHKPDAKIAVLYMNDDTKEAVKGLRDGLGSRADQLIVKELSYEVTDPTIDSQIVAFKASGADTFYNVSAPKSAAQAIRKASEIGWKPLHFLSFGSQSISAVLEPAGLENSIGTISAFFLKIRQTLVGRTTHTPESSLSGCKNITPEASRMISSLLPATILLSRWFTCSRNAATTFPAKTSCGRQRAYTMLRFPGCCQESRLTQTRPITSRSSSFLKVDLMEERGSFLTIRTKCPHRY